MLIIRRNNQPAVYRKLVNNAMNERWNEQAASHRPAVNIYEDEEGFTIELAAPGLDKADFKLEQEKEVLSISAEKQVAETEKHSVIRKEFGFGSFTRQFSLPKSANREQINAEYVNGILTVNVPKKKEAPVEQRTRQIEVA